MQIRLLGTVDVVVDGEVRPVRGLRRKAVLATLALHGGDVVSTDRLADAVWGECAPAALNTLQSHVSYLRGVLGDKAAILARPPGYRQAIIFCGQALAGSRDAGELNWESAAWDSLGYIHHKLGDYQRAVTCYERSLDLCREMADRFNEAGTLDRLGDVHDSAGDTSAARWAWTQALRTLDELGHPDSDRVRAKLRVPGSRLSAVI